MLTKCIDAALGHARYELIEDGEAPYYGKARAGRFGCRWSALN